MFLSSIPCKTDATNKENENCAKLNGLKMRINQISIWKEDDALHCTLTSTLH